MRATYRLQLGPHLDFAGARGLVPYLKDLGISHLYLSPSFQSRSGSTHGYDVVDPRQISTALGGEDEFKALCRAGLGVILDIVPNHMAASEENPFWRDRMIRAKFFDLDDATGRHRRFFDIDELAGVRIEEPEVFEVTHSLLFRLVGEGLVTGVRVDHVDGLADPAGYLRRLRDSGVDQVWVEKILEGDEELRDWPVEGTTGYEFLNDLQGLFVDPAGERTMTALYSGFTGEDRRFGEIAFEAKREQAATTFRPEVERLWNELPSEDEFDLAGALASFSVYRTYVEPLNCRVAEADRAAIQDAELPDRLSRLLLLEEEGYDGFVSRFQQTTGAVMAKGVEDTAFYRYNRLLALNEVGGDPGRFGLSVDTFHARNIARMRRFPRTMLATSTHDTKRSADVRARIGTLAGRANEWREHVLRWRELAAPLRRERAPDPSEEYLIYQTLVGAWPIEAERLDAYLEKALREAKVNTSWVNQNQAWEADVKQFARGLLGHQPFLDEFGPFADAVRAAGEEAALRQLVLKLTVPGIPDIYQGDETWYLALVDPDNRRPVDWESRRELLAEVRAGAPSTRESRKLMVLARLLELRSKYAAAFEGSYVPLDAGPAACGFLRGGDVLVYVALRPGGEDEVVRLPSHAAGRWRDVLSGEELTLEDSVSGSNLVAENGLRLLCRP